MSGRCVLQDRHLHRRSEDRQSTRNRSGRWWKRSDLEFNQIRTGVKAASRSEQSCGALVGRIVSIGMNALVHLRGKGKKERESECRNEQTGGAPIDSCRTNAKRWRPHLANDYALMFLRQEISTALAASNSWRFARARTHSRNNGAG